MLAKIPKLRVMAQSTVSRYKGRDIDPQATGRELNVRAVLIGRLMQSGGSLRIRTELVDVATGSQLWGGQYDRKPGDIIDVEGANLRRDIAKILRPRVDRDRKDSISETATRKMPRHTVFT